MKKEIKDRWVAALRSGEYKQTRHTLHDGAGFCCLGVLCDLHSKETGQDWIGFAPSKLYCGEQDILPTAVVVWAGFGHADTVESLGTAKSPGFELTREDVIILRASEKGLSAKTIGAKRSLASINDQGVGFKDIASIIERHF